MPREGFKTLTVKEQLYTDLNTEADKRKISVPKLIRKALDLLIVSERRS